MVDIGAQFADRKPRGYRGDARTHAVEIIGASDTPRGFRRKRCSDRCFSKAKQSVVRMRRTANLYVWAVFVFWAMQILRVYVGP